MVTADLQFFDDDRPPLPAGDYRVVVSQSVRLPPQFASPADYVHSQGFQVTGPHFALGADAVVSVYPPAGTVADRHTTLPHVVLAGPDLPWRIGLDPLAAGAAEPATGDPDPWLALLVLRPDEIAYPPDAVAAGNLTGTQVVPLTDYLTPPAGTAGPAFDPTQVARFARDYPELRCSVVDVDATAFADIAPTRTDLPLLTHVREVDTTDQEVDTTAGWYSVVVANRFPSARTDGLYAAHLVSLEGLARRLPPASPTHDRVRLLSLHSWTFHSLAATDNFDALMAALDVGPLRLTPPEDACRQLSGSQHAPDPARDLVGRALARGYTAAPYRMRLGELTTAWYHGPCAPVRWRRNLQPAYHNAESALLFDPDTGLFDVSFATAWQTGRLLALANRGFAVALLDWLRSLGRISHLLADRLDLFQRYEVLTTPESIADLLAPGAARDAVLDLLGSHLAPSVLGTRYRPGALGRPLDPSGLPGPHRAPGVLTDAEVSALSSEIDAFPVGVGVEGGLERAAVELARRGPRPATSSSPAGVPSIADPLPGAAAEPPATPTWRPRPDRTAHLLAHPAAASAVLDQAPPFPDAAGRWLARLCLLEGVPFEQLVPDARMLPIESLRFFTIDQNWLDALVDGALSIGGVADLESRLLAATRPELRALARERARLVRRTRRAERISQQPRAAARAAQLPAAAAGPAAGGPAPVWTGLILRSALVSGWPGLQVRSPGLDLLRLDRPAPDVLIAIFAGVADEVEISTPAQGLHFGAVDDSGVLSVAPRALGDGLPAGGQLPVPAVVVPSRRDTGPERCIVDLGELRNRLQEKVTEGYAPRAAPRVGPGALGVELVAAAERQRFVSRIPDREVAAEFPRSERVPAPRDVRTLLAALAGDADD